MTDETETSSESADIDVSESADSAPKRVTPQIDREKLKQGAKVTGRALWGTIGFLASVGGAIGLIQFLSSSDPQPVGADALLIAMVAEGVISEEQAVNLGQVLSGESSELGEEGSEALGNAIEDQDEAAVLAMAQMLNSETYTEGLDLLEASAASADDWMRIAELSVSRDPKRGVKAARKALELDRSNFRASTLMVQLQAQSGDYQTARRSAESARIMATTPLERLMAEKAALNVTIMGAATDRLEADNQRFEEALAGYRASVDETLPETRLTSQTLDDHPMWIVAVAQQTQAGAAQFMEKPDEALALSLEAKAAFETLEAHIEPELLRSVKRRQIHCLEQIAYSHAVNENDEDAYAAYRDIISIWEELSAANDPGADEAMAMAWGHLGQSLYADEKKEEAIAAYARAKEIADNLSAAEPDNSELRILSVQMDTIMSFLNATDENADALKAAQAADLDESAAALIRDPLDAQKQGKYQLALRNSFSTLARDLEKNLADFETLFSSIDLTAERVEAKLGPNYYTYLLRAQAEGLRGYVDLQQDDVPAAKAHYETARDLSDLILNAPYRETYDAEKAGITLISSKLSALWVLANLDDEDAVKAARSGLLLAEGLDASGQLKTADRSFISGFKKRIEELEAENKEADK